jgi:hypothetical protein
MPRHRMPSPPPAIRKTIAAAALHGVLLAGALFSHA